MLQIQIADQSTTPQSTIQHLTTLIYNQYQMPTICDLIFYPLDLEDTMLLIRDPNFANNYYIVIKICENASKGQQQSIEKLIGLSDKVVGIELEQELESTIEKYYLTVMPELYIRYAQSGGFVKRPSLCFVNESYRKMYSREAEGIYYYRNVEEYTATLPAVKNMRESMVTLAQSRVNRIKNDNSVDAGDVPSITIGQMLSLYKNNLLSEKEAAQIKYSMLSYKQLLFLKKKREKAEQYIFKQGLNDVNKSVLRRIGQQNLGKKYMSKLQWKYERIKNFGQLLYEQQINRQLVKKYKKCTLFDLQQDSIILQIRQFYRIWIRNTLKTLRVSFNEIANRRDTKAVSQFRQKCQQCISILNNCILHCRTDTQNYTILLDMHREIQEYINAHENVIKDQYLSAVKFMVYGFRYRWRNQPKIYHKGGFFVLVLMLAWMQGNIIIGLALVSVGLIFLAINI